ncbi:MAG: translational GTPase TypA [Alphaproteobacteria bacterium]|jgi:GTP-binding protein|nr:translational GTPase TypA [Alphaproteobacteria bacterium]MDP6256608.1 translational GTPase TypA [Alphaproteobacteria bacterium]MDP7230715.1 translational GTPase TypA [Alphaproteobacteria bacterium]MDP7460099.1 translational GTPase TypA [Alphaproteobacteria bacterium]HJM91428.1 translational GTPase TypA [Alphaproteobacteria bacterium]|tara:strand:- start:21439 stop:23262 length:1824 start_codon:yes stop_codon:yes gene_type:complete
MPLRNIAIIAHVDHGKTTLVDALFRQLGTFRANQQIAERAMDSNDLERERGITILSKCTSIEWQDTRINIVDTPGHADFGGEVERILKMVDGVVLLVDAAEGPMPQTKFVTGKALALGLRPIVVINKIDRGDARPDEVLDEVFDLFTALEANEDQLDFPYLYAVGRDGWASDDAAAGGGDLTPLFELLLRHVPTPTVDKDAPFSMIATLLDADPYLGRVLTGRVESGRLAHNDTIRALRDDGSVVETTRVTKLLAFRGLDRVSVDEVVAGDIIAIAGLQQATVADTIADPEVIEPIIAPPIDPPTLATRFSINDSPLAGQDGSKVQSRVIRDRLLSEAEGNVAIKISETSEKDAFEVAGRGELQLGVLIETMRREGFELTIGRPRVLYRSDPQTGQRMEPIEEVSIDVDDEFTGVVVEKMAERKGEMTDMRPFGIGRTRITFLAPSRGLIGYHGEFLTDTRGTGIMNRLYHSYAPFKGQISGRHCGAIVSAQTGEAVPFALWHLEERGVLFIGGGEQVYAGMVIGENAKPSDLEVNPLKAKQLTNIRASGKDDAVRLTTPRRMSLEQAIAYIGDDEVVEVTPNHIRLRKATLDPHQRKRERRAAMAG